MERAARQAGLIGPDGPLYRQSTHIVCVGTAALEWQLLDRYSEGWLSFAVDVNKRHHRGRGDEGQSLRAQAAQFGDLITELVENFQEIWRRFDAEGMRWSSAVLELAPGGGAQISFEYGEPPAMDDDEMREAESALEEAIDNYYKTNR